MIRKQLLVLLFTSIFCCHAIGQRYTTEYGKVGKDEIELKEYAPDKDAEAVVLFDIGSTRFEEINRSFELVFERKTRIKILSEAGIKWAEIEVPFYQEAGYIEKIYDIEAYTYNYNSDNGQIDRNPLDISNTFDEKINAYWNKKKFAIPNVKVGSIIEYKYKIKSRILFNLRDWEFQWKIPVVYSEYEARMIPFYTYMFVLQGATKFDSQTSIIDNREIQYGPVKYQDYIHRYIMKDVPAFKSEDYITSINDYIIKLDFQLSKITYPNGRTEEIMTTWEKMKADLLKNNDLGKYIKNSEKLASKIINVDSIKSKTDKEKFDFVLNFVKRNYNWNKFNGKLATKTPKKLENEKNGSSADINLFTIGLLNAIGIDAKPVILSTRENGKIKYDYPFLNYFDYVILLANIDGEKVISDATEVLNLNNRIPSRCINDKGLIIDKEKVEWLNLEFKNLSEIKNEYTLELINNDILNANVCRTAVEYDALYYRNYYGNDMDVIKKRLNNKDYTIVDSTLNVQNQFDKEKPYILSFKQNGKPEIINEKIYISPFLNEVISDNPLKQNERTYPVDMIYPIKRTFTTTIIIPEGYHVEYAPFPQNIKDRLFELNYNIKQEEGSMKVSFDYTFNHSVYSPNDYTKIKSFFDGIVRKGNEKIVLAKKSM